MCEAGGKKPHVMYAGVLKRFDVTYSDTFPRALAIEPSMHLHTGPDHERLIFTIQQRGRLWGRGRRRFAH